MCRAAFRHQLSKRSKAFLSRHELVVASGKSLRSLSRYQCLRIKGGDSFVDLGVAVVQLRRLGLLSSMVFGE